MPAISLPCEPLVPEKSRLKHSKNSIFQNTPKKFACPQKRGPVEKEVSSSKHWFSEGYLSFSWEALAFKTRFRGGLVDRLDQSSWKLTSVPDLNDSSSSDHSCRKNKASRQVHDLEFLMETSHTFKKMVGNHPKLGKTRWKCLYRSWRIITRSGRYHVMKDHEENILKNEGIDGKNRSRQWSITSHLQQVSACQHLLWPDAMTRD